MSQSTRNKIEQYLHEQVSRYWDDNVASAKVKGKARPLHSALSPTAMSFWEVASSHSFYTRSGSWWQHLAKIVSDEYHAIAINDYSVEGEISAAAEAHIDQVLEDLDRGNPRRIPNRERDTREVLTVQGATGQSRTEISDLYVRTDGGAELYFEIKTPEPNKAHCKEMKGRILSISALRKGFDAHVFAACPYNPYSTDGDGTPYSWNYAIQFLEVGRDWLVGRDFWKEIGETSTYDEILSICHAVGSDLESKVGTILGLGD